LLWFYFILEDGFIDVSAVMEKYILVAGDFDSDVSWVLFITSAENFEAHHFKRGMSLFFSEE
jgi:hypothetical protein|tara:strand:- start:469 stop:654 length:186 start_codon:yes stop_codon:yes gene_type:complete